MSDTKADDAAARKARYRDIVTGVFSLVLGLAAFSITTADLGSPGEVWDALAVFAPAFFFVLAIWQTGADLFDVYPADDALFYPLMTLVLFLATPTPAFLNLLLAEEPAVRRLAAVLFSLAMAAVFAALGALWLRLGALARRGRAPGAAGAAAGDDSRAAARDEALTCGFLVALFLASLLAPYHDGTSPRTLVWFAAFVLPGVLLWLRRRAGRAGPPRAGPSGRPPPPGALHDRL